jgi:hypothetical protein
MDGERALGGREARQAGEEGGHRAGLRAGHGGADGPGGALHVPGQSEDHRPAALGGAVADEQLVLEQPQSGLALAADREREREAPRDLGVAAALEDESIVALRVARLAGNVVGQAPVARDLELGHSEVGGVAEEFERGVRLLELGERRADPHLDPAVARHLLLGAREEGQGRLRVAEVERGLAGPHQRVDALRVGGEAAKVARQRALRALGESAGRGGLRHSGRGRKHCPRPQQGQAKPDAPPQ